MTITVPKTNANPDGDPNGPLSVWLKFEDDIAGIDPHDGEAAYEANVYATDEGGHCVEWYHTFVGAVSAYYFPSLRDAQEWLEANGYTDYTVEEN